MQESRSEMSELQLYDALCKGRHSPALQKSLIIPRARNLQRLGPTRREVRGNEVMLKRTIVRGAEAHLNRTVNSRELLFARLPEPTMNTMEAVQKAAKAVFKRLFLANEPKKPMSYGSFTEVS